MEGNSQMELRERFFEPRRTLSLSWSESFINSEEDSLEVKDLTGPLTWSERPQLYREDDGEKLLAEYENNELRELLLRNACQFEQGVNCCVDWSCAIGGCAVMTWAGALGLWHAYNIE